MKDASQRVDVLQRLHRLLVQTRSAARDGVVARRRLERIGQALLKNDPEATLQTLAAEGVPRERGATRDVEEVLQRRVARLRATVAGADEAAAFCWALGHGLVDLAELGPERALVVADELHNAPVCLLHGQPYRTDWHEDAVSLKVLAAWKPTPVEGIVVVEVHPWSRGDGGLRPLAPRSGCVPLGEVTTPGALDLLLRLHLPVGTEPTAAGSIAGGFALRRGDDLLEPGCCCDLGDLEVWRAALEERSEVELAIGHGLWRVHAGPRATKVTLHGEHGEPPKVWFVPSRNLQEELTRAVRLRGRVAKRLVSHLEATGRSECVPAVRGWVQDRS